MGLMPDIESLKRIFMDPRTWIGSGILRGIEVSPDLSVVRAKMEMFPDGGEVIVRLPWALLGPESGVIELPESEDLFLVAFVEGDEDDGYAFCRLSSKDDKLPLRAIMGYMVIRSRSGNTLSLSSDTKVLAGRGGLIEEDEPFVLGNVLKDALNDFMTSFDTHMGDVDTHLSDLQTGPVGFGNLGYDVPTHPTLITKIALSKTAIAAAKTQLALDMAKYLTIAATNIVSQIAFTER